MAEEEAKVDSGDECLACCGLVLIIAFGAGIVLYLIWIAEGFIGAIFLGIVYISILAGLALLFNDDKFISKLCWSGAVIFLISTILFGVAIFVGLTPIVLARIGEVFSLVLLGLIFFNRYNKKVVIALFALSQLLLIAAMGVMDDMVIAVSIAFLIFMFFLASLTYEDYYKIFGFFSFAMVFIYSTLMVFLWNQTAALGMLGALLIAALVVFIYQHRRQKAEEKKERIRRVMGEGTGSGSGATEISGEEDYIAILGGGGSGKTVFFAMLVKVLGSGKYSDMWIEYVEGLAYLRDIRESLEQGRWPDKTFVGEKSGFRANIYEKKALRTKVHKLILTDIAGEDFERTFDPETPTRRLPPPLKHIPISKAFIWILDPSRTKEDTWKYYSLLQFLIRIKDLGHTRRMKEPVAVVFSKTDEHPDIQADPEGFARSSLGDLYTPLRNRTRHLGFFAVSAIGAKDKHGRPRRPLSPVGLAEVLEWILNPTKPRTAAGPATPAPALAPVSVPTAAPATKSRPRAEAPPRRATAKPAAAKKAPPKGTAERKAADPIEVYRKAVEQALEDGVITDDEENILKGMRGALGITDKQHWDTIKEVMMGK